MRWLVVLCVLLCGVATAHARGSRYYGYTVIYVHPPPKKDTAAPPMVTVEPPAQVVEPPMVTVEPPAETVEPPAQVVEPPMVTVEPPAETVEPPMVAVEPPEETPPLLVETPTEQDCISTDEQEFMVVVRIPVPASDQTFPTSITAVLDRSGSMANVGKLDNLKAAARCIVERVLGPEDRFGIVSFASQARVDSPLVSVTEDEREELSAVIDAIRANGTTNLAGGLFEGIDQQTGASQEGFCAAAVILFTDGMPNSEAIPDLVELADQLNEAADPPVVHTIGFAAGADGILLEDIARVSGGEFGVVDEADDIPVAIGRSLDLLRRAQVRNVKVTLTPAEGVEILAKRDSFNQSSLTMSFFPILEAGTTEEILLTVRVPAVDGPVDVFEILEYTVEYTDCESGDLTMEEQVIGVKRTDDVDELSEASVDSAVIITSLRFRVSDSILEAARAAQGGDVTGAQEILDRTLAELEGSSAAGTPVVQALVGDVENAREAITERGSAGINEALAIGSSLASGTGIGEVRSNLATETESQQQTEMAAGEFVCGPAQLSPDPPTQP